MNRKIIAAIALGLASVSIADAALAQCGPNALACVPQRPGASHEVSDFPTPEVCFYTGTDYKGLFFCEAGSRSVQSMPAQWRGKIKSISVGDHTTVRVCPADVLQGDCALIGGNVRKLEPGLFNHVNSYAISQVY